MALLQISEPGLSSAPHQRRLAAGIDLGTTNSLVASVRSGEATTLSDAQGRDSLPSIVHYSNLGIEVGHIAKEHAISDATNTVVSVKRFMGRTLSDIQAQHSELPYVLSATENGLINIQTRSGLVNPIQVSSEILKPLIALASDTLGGELDGVVITVPAYFDDAQRQGTKDAAELLGVKVFRLLNEPTAAAIAYGLDNHEDEGIIAVYDLGGGTFDISILRLSKGVFEVLATGGDSALGGDDFDEALSAWIFQQAGYNGEHSPALQREITMLACQTKETLSKQEQCELSLSLPCGSQWQGEITREIFNQIIAPLVKRTVMACRRAVRDAQISIDEIQQIVMVGGSTRVPLVREQIAGYFERELLTSIDPDKVVALGAAIQADILAGNKPDSDILLLDVLPLSLGLETMGGLTEKVIARNTTIPVAKAQEFTTFKDGQTAMALHILQGERELVDDCRSLARFELRGIPPMAAGAAHIRVTFQVDADGLLSVSAMEKSSGVAASIEVKPSFGLTDNEVANMIKDSMTYARDDMDARMLAEEKVEASRVLEGLVSAINADGHLLEETQLKPIKQAMVVLETAAQHSDLKAIKDAIAACDNVSQDFAALRMDQSIRKALSGQSVDDL